MHVVLSIGGSSINPNGEPDTEWIRKMAKVIMKSKHSFGIVTGGGKTAREYANAARLLGASEFDADEVAILATRQNASLMLAALKGVSFGKVIRKFSDAKEAAKENKVVVMGGTIPGITTDADSVLLAEAIGAKRIVNISNVPAIYDSDPRKNKNAKRYLNMTYQELNQLAVKSDQRMAGTHFVFDMLACKLIARSKIETHFVSRDNFTDITNAIEEGKKHSGTVVK